MTTKEVTITLHLTEEEIAYMERFAKHTCAPSLGIEWKSVAAGWAVLGIRRAIENQIKDGIA